MDVKGVIRGFIDNILEPPITFLNLAIEKISGVSLITSQGLNVGQYLSVFGDLPAAWQLLVSSLFISTVMLGTLIIFKSVMRMYFTVKEGVKWW